MYKSQILGLLLATTIFIGSSAISMQAFADKPDKSKHSEKMYDSYAEDSYGMQYDQPYYPSHKQDNPYNYDNTYNKYSNQYHNFVCGFGLFKGFVVKDPYACFVKLPECPQCSTDELDTSGESGVAGTAADATGQNEETEKGQVQTNSIQPMLAEPVQQQKQPTQMNSPNHQLEQLEKLQQLKAQKLSETLK